MIVINLIITFMNTSGYRDNWNDFDANNEEIMKGCNMVYKFRKEKYM